MNFAKLERQSAYIYIYIYLRVTYISWLIFSEQPRKSFDDGDTRSSEEDMTEFGCMMRLGLSPVRFRSGFPQPIPDPKPGRKKTNRTEGQKGRTVSEPSVLAGEPDNSDERVYAG